MNPDEAVDVLIDLMDPVNDNRIRLEAAETILSLAGPTENDPTAPKAN
jgi:hypothetical protein